jgi:hypothetical protein
VLEECIGPTHEDSEFDRGTVKVVHGLRLASLEGWTRRGPSGFDSVGSPECTKSLNLKMISCCLETVRPET